MNALEVVASRVAAPFARRRMASSFDDWISLFSPDAMGLLLSTTLQGSEEHVDSNFAGFAQGLYLRNSVVFACLSLRARLFSEARFVWQQMRNGRPGNLFGTPALRVLEYPEPGKTTRDMLAAAILDADLAGNGFLLRRGDRIVRLRPDWTLIAYGSRQRALEVWDPDAEVIGYGYQQGGPASGAAMVTYSPDEVCHFVTNHDPLARNRGIPLLTAGLREIMADNAATTHKLAFFNNAATPNLAVKFPPALDRAKAEQWKELFEQEHRGAERAYATIFLGGGAEAQLIGSTMQQQTFAELQSAVESRIAALTGMHRIVAALSETAAGSINGAGTYGSAARLVGDATLWPLWGNIAGSLQSIVRPPNPGARLWVDGDIPFLREDRKDQANILESQAHAIGGLIKDGFTPDSIIDAVTTGDYTRLVHTGLVSVQLVPPQSRELPTDAPPATGGARMFHSITTGRLRALLERGYRPASTLDEELVRRALLAGGRDSWAGPDREEIYLATGDFWPIGGALGSLDSVEAGQELPGDHPLIAAYPGMFSPAVVRVSEAPKPQLGPGPVPIVSRAEVLAKRTELEAAGLPAGIDSLARAFNVHASTIRRRLNERTETST